MGGPLFNCQVLVCFVGGKNPTAKVSLPGLEPTGLECQGHPIYLQEPGLQTKSHQSTPPTCLMGYLANFLVFTQTQLKGMHKVHEGKHAPWMYLENYDTSTASPGYSLEPQGEPFQPGPDVFCLLRTVASRRGLRAEPGIRCVEAFCGCLCCVWRGIILLLLFFFGGEGEGTAF